MKKLVVLLILISQIVIGQGINRQNVGLSIGASMPLSDFRKDILNDSTSGFAKTGVALSFNYMYRLTHNFGMQLIINYSSNAMDNIKYRNALEAEHPDYGVSVASTKNWTSGGLYLGPYLRLPIGDKLSWDLRALFGFMGAYSPSITIRTTNKENPNEKGEYYIVSSRANNFSYSIGTGFKYRIRSNYYLLLFGDYVKSSMDFKDSSGWDWDSEPYVKPFSREINYITITAGVSYIL